MKQIVFFLVLYPCILFSQKSLDGEFLMVGEPLPCKYYKSFKMFSMDYGFILQDDSYRLEKEVIEFHRSESDSILIEYKYNIFGELSDAEYFYQLNRPGIMGRAFYAKYFYDDKSQLERATFFSLMGKSEMPLSEVNFEYGHDGRITSIIEEINENNKITSSYWRGGIIKEIKFDRPPGAEYNGASMHIYEYSGDTSFSIVIKYKGDYPLFYEGLNKYKGEERADTISSTYPSKAIGFEFNCRPLLDNSGRIDSIKLNKDGVVRYKYSPEGYISEMLFYQQKKSARIKPQSKFQCNLQKNGNQYFLTKRELSYKSYTKKYYLIKSTTYYLSKINDDKTSGDGIISISASPQPAGEALKVSLGGLPEENFNISIWTISGGAIYQEEFYSKAGQFQTDIDLTGKPAGFYLLKIECGGKTATQKIIRK